MKIKREKWIPLLAALLGVLLILIGLLFFTQNYVILGGSCYRRDIQSLDLENRPMARMDRLAQLHSLKSLNIRKTGITRAQRDWLQEKLPDCEILWELPFQGQLVPPDAQSITVPVLKMEDPEQMQVFPALQQILIEDCEDYSALDVLRQQYPDSEIRYTVDLGGGEWAPNAEHLVLEDVDPEQIRERLPYLPEAKTALLTGVLPAMEEIRKLEEDFPDVELSWEVTLGEDKIDGDADYVDLWKTEIQDPQEFLDVLTYFPELETVDLIGTGLSNEEKRSLVDTCPDLEFLWEIQVGEEMVSADSEEAEVTGQTFASAEALQAALACFPDLKKIAILDSNLTNEELDSVNQALLPDTRLIWNFNIGGVELRTDSLYYAPNKYYKVSCTEENTYPLRYCTDMLCVDVGHRPIRTCEWAAYMPKLKYLIMADTGIQDLTPLKDLKELVFLEIFMTPLRDFSPLLGCTALEDLNLCFSFGSYEPIQEMTWLHNLWWDGPSLPRQQLAEKLPDTKIEYDSGSSTGAGWRNLQNYYDMRDLLGMKYLVG